MAETIRLTSIEGGGNWWKVLNWVDEALRAAGFETKITRYGDDGMNTMTRIADGEADLAVTLSCAAWMGTRDAAFSRARPCRCAASR